jgi:ATP-binding cassette subfamily F protein 3
LGSRSLFSNLNLQVVKGDRVGLIGPNGAGKTTLLRLISGKFKPEEGSVELQSGATVGFLEQDVLEVSLNMTVRELAMQAFTEVLALEKKLDFIGHELATRTDYESAAYMKLLEDLEKTQQRFFLLDGDRIESKASEVLAGLGFAESAQKEPIENFSGGWRMRVLLAQLLLKKPDVLLLDEPTNHLDIDTIEWLQKYLSAYDGAVVIVSHDRYFIDRMVNKIAELRNSRIYTYTGNYEKYLVQREEMIELQQNAYDNQQKKIATTERFIERFKAKATKAKQAQSRVKQLEKLERVEAPEGDSASVSFKFPNPPRAGNVIMGIESLKKDYDGMTVFTSAQDLHINRGDKIALIGPNGSGKSTLARILDGLEPFSGKRSIGHNVLTGFFAQHLAEVLSTDITILESMDEVAKTADSRRMIRTLLGNFLFTGDDVFKPIKVLSGGERSRVALARTLLEPVNFMVLDEPTNHLDIASKDVLVQALKSWEGTLLVVSHDRHFIEQFATKVWRTGNGRVEEYDGGFDYYLWKTQSESAASTDLAKEPSRTEKKKEAPAPVVVKAPTENRKPSTDHAELKKLEKRISDLEKDKARMETELADPMVYSLPDYPHKVKAYKDVETELERVTDRWLMLQE